LLLNGASGQRPNRDTVGGWNAGVGFRYTTTYGNVSDDYNAQYWDIADDDTWDAELIPIWVEVSEDGEYFNEFSTVLIHLDDNGSFPPADSRWIDKITIESAATTPSGWISDTL
jgi:hypothetical protein